MKNVKSNVIIKITVVIIFLGLICIRILSHFYPFYFNMSSGSMEPSILEKERILVNRLAYIGEKPQRGDIIVYKKPSELSKLWTHRITGLPGEKIEIKNGTIYINDKAWIFPDKNKQIYYYNKGVFEKGVSKVIPDKMYFVLGDNSSESLDSRYWGFVPEENIVGKVVLIISKDKQIRKVR